MHAPLPMKTEPGFTVSMPDWVGRLMAFRGSDAYRPAEAVAQSLRHLETNDATAAVGDIYQPTIPLVTYEIAPGIRKRLFFELIAWTDAEMTVKLDELDRFLAVFSTDVPRRSFLPGISPHAPQTVGRFLLEAACERAARHNMPVAIHLAESPEEMQLLHDGSGSMVERLRLFDPHYDPARVRLGRRPLDYLRFFESVGCFPVSIVHGNYLDDAEMRFLADHADRFTLVHCPRCCAYFRFPVFPIRKLLGRGVRIALGTDSRASCPDLEIAHEADFLRQRHPWLDEETLHTMLTVNGSVALGLA